MPYYWMNNFWKCQLLRRLPMKPIPGSLRIAYWQQLTHYHGKKTQKQADKTKLAYRHDASRLKRLRVSMTDLVPNFFTSSLPIHEKQKIQVSAPKSYNHLQNSFIQLEIPILEEPALLNSLRKFRSNQVRIGRVMEVMDSVAGMVGYRHCFGSLSDPNPFVLVTGCVDSINLFEPITVDENISIEGYVNYVGKTSIEIEINLYQGKTLKSNALFMMISRDASDHSKGYPCPSLALQALTPQEASKAEQRKLIGLSNVERRKSELKQSYLNSVPTYEDLAILHRLFLRHRKSSPEAMDRQAELEYSISETTILNTILMHAHERNVHGKIFGGFLMRELLETAWITANRHLQGGQFHIQDITNVYFVSPVEIGTELSISAKIAYTHSEFLVVYAEARAYNTTTKRDKLCSHFHVSFRSERSEKVREVYPLSYQNGMIYLAAKNAFEQLF